jgi:hypothetical protein
MGRTSGAGVSGWLEGWSAPITDRRAAVVTLAILALSAALWARVALPGLTPLESG